VKIAVVMTQSFDVGMIKLVAYSQPGKIMFNH